MNRLLIIFMCLAFAGCSSPRPHPLAVPSPFQIALPFLGDSQDSELLRSITETASVVLEPIEGISGEFGAALLSAVAEAAQENDIPLATGVEAISADRLRGRFEPRIVRGVGLDGVIVWRLFTSDGELIDGFETRAPMRAYADWDDNIFDLENVAWREAMASQTARALAQVLDARPATAARLAGLPGAGSTSGPPIMVPPVTGAPGDGELSLTRAVRALLAQTGVVVVDPALPPEDFDAGSAYTLQGLVQLGEVLPEGGQPIVLSWDLYSPQGNHLGNIAQQNLIEPGSLDGAWGEVAIFAAMGAVEGIFALLATLPPEGN